MLPESNPLARLRARALGAACLATTVLVPGEVLAQASTDATLAGTGEVPAPRVFNLPPGIGSEVAGAVFTMSNSADPVRGNEILAFHRLADGSLSIAGVFPTGELGSGPAPTSTVFGAPVPATADGLGTQGGLLISEPLADGSRQLFAVNAGSNSVTCFVVSSDASGPMLSDPVTVPSGGLFPASVDVRGSLLYVLNSGGGGNVTGFTVDADCTMTRVRGGQGTLAGLINDPPFPDPAPNEVLTTAADIGFNPAGNELVVSIKGGPDGQGGGFEGGIAVFDVRDDGAIMGPPTVTEFSGDTDTAGPFGLDIRDDGLLVLNHANSFTTAAYRINADGTLTQVGAPVPISGLFDRGLSDATSVLAFGGFNCWLVVVDDVVYVINFGDIPATNGGIADGPGAVVALDIAADDSLSLVPTAGEPGLVAVFQQDDRNDPNAEIVGSHGIDLDVIVDGPNAFLYYINPRIGAIAAFSINADDTLTPIGRFRDGIAFGVDPFVGTNPGINDFLERCFLDPEPSPECAAGSAQGMTGF